MTSGSLKKGSYCCSSHFGCCNHSETIWLHSYIWDPSECVLHQGDYSSDHTRGITAVTTLGGLQRSLHRGDYSGDHTGGITVVTTPGGLQRSPHWGDYSGDYTGGITAVTTPGGLQRSLHRGDYSGDHTRGIIAVTTRENTAVTIRRIIPRGWRMLLSQGHHKSNQLVFLCK